MKELRKLPHCIKMCMSIGELPTSYMESLTYEEQLIWFCKFLEETVIPVVNNNSEVTQELQNWFNELDVQDEINNKLEQMAEDGTLEEIISAYINSNAIWSFNTVSDMKQATNLINGSTVKTLGFYNISDGGSSIYKIRTVTSADVIDEKFIISLNNTSLVAELVLESDTLDIRKIGATTEIDIHDHILTTITKNLECFIPNGRWKTSPIQLAKYNTTRISGYPITAANNSIGTILTPISDQEYIMKIGYTSPASNCVDVNMHNIMFSTGDYTVTNALVIQRVGFSNFSEISFRSCKCTNSALKITEMWETRWGRSLFRVIDSPFALIFGSRVGSGNISTNYFEYLSFEGCRGNCIKFENDSQYSMSTIDTIDFESGIVAFDDESRVSINEVEDYNALAIIVTENGKGEISINNFNVNAIAQHAYINSTTGSIRAFDTLIKCNNTDTGYYSFAIGNVSGVGNIKKPTLINANTIDKFYLNNYIFQGGTYFDAIVNGCRIFNYLPNKFANNYETSHLDIANRDLKIDHLRPYCKGTTGRAVRVATLITEGNVLHVHAKGNGRISYGGSDHVTLNNVEDYQWFEIPMETSQLGSSVNLLLGTGSTVEVDNYFFTYTQPNE